MTAASPHGVKDGSQRHVQSDVMLVAADYAVEVDAELGQVVVFDGESELGERGRRESEGGLVRSLISRITRKGLLLQWNPSIVDALGTW